MTNPALQKTPFDVTKDFAPIAIVGATPVALAVHPSVPANSVKELIALAKKEPGKLSYSSCGNGTAMHLAGELLKQVAGIDMVHVAYKGCGPAIADGIGGQVPILFNTLTNLSAQAKGGKVKLLAVASASRSQVDKDTPTIAEAGGFPDFDADIWFGFLAPAKTPREIITKLNAALSTAMKDPGVQEKMSQQLFSYRTSTPEEFSKTIASDLAKWSKLVKEAKIQAEP